MLYRIKQVLAQNPMFERVYVSEQKNFKDSYGLNDWTFSTREKATIYGYKLALRYVNKLNSWTNPLSQTKYILESVEIVLRVCTCQSPEFARLLPIAFTRSGMRNLNKNREHIGKYFCHCGGVAPQGHISKNWDHISGETVVNHLIALGVLDKTRGY